LGTYFPSFLEPRRRCEQAIVAVVMEAYVNGVSTRKVDRLVEQLGIHGMSKDRVSALCRELYPDVVDGLENEGGVPSRLIKDRCRCWPAGRHANGGCSQAPRWGGR
jgi:hypothetical protein